MTAIATRAALTRLSRPLRLRAGAGWVAVALGAAGLLLGLMAWTVRLGVVATPWWVLVAWGLALLVLAGSAAAAWRGLHALSVRRVARRLEDTGLTRQGALTALLDLPATGTSESLFAQADRAQAGAACSWSRWPPRFDLWPHRGLPCCFSERWPSGAPGRAEGLRQPSGIRCGPGMRRWPRYGSRPPVVWWTRATRWPSGSKRSAGGPRRSG
jgi:hypothetical protein